MVNWKGRQENQWILQTIYLGNRVAGKDPGNLYKRGVTAQNLFYVIASPRRQYKAEDDQMINLANIHI